jgi:enoyl-CoA hydratase
VAVVSVESQEGITVVRLDRPPANALDPELLEEARAVAEQLGEAQPGAVVLTGRERFFSAGLDLKLVPTLDHESQRAMIMGVNRLVAAWYALPCPVVCAVSGHAIAGGLVLALCADYRVGSTTGKLGLTETRVGVPYPAAAMIAVRSELTPPVARVLALRAELLDPPAALEAGLLDELAPPDAVLERAIAVALELGAMPSRAYAQVKRQLRAPAIAEMERIVAGGSDPLAETWLSDDTGLAAAAVLRKPSG